MSFFDEDIADKTTGDENTVDKYTVDEEVVWPADTPSDTLSDSLGPIGAWTEDYCLACTHLAPLPDLQLCASCLARWHRDLIRQRRWRCSELAWDLTTDEREALRSRIIARFGEEFEIFDHELAPALCG